jgi:DNA-binding beta-propeller fold protein YncE
MRIRTSVAVALALALAGGVVAVAQQVILPDEYRTPQGTRLRPAGTQIDTSRAPTGIDVSPNSQVVFAINSGPFEQKLEVVDANTLTKTAATATDLFLGVVGDDEGNVWASTGSRNRIFQFKYEGNAAADARSVGILPGTPNEGIPAYGYPGNLEISSDQILYVASNISMPQSYIQEVDPKAGPCPGGAPVADPICSAINVIDVSSPHEEASAYSVHLVPVGRDAYGIQLNGRAKKVYVSNWADGSNPRRAHGTGTVSVVDISSSGSEREVQAIPVGRHPTGLALSPDRTRLVVANSASDSITIMRLNARGMVIRKRTVSVKPTKDSQRGTTPLAVAWGPNSHRIFVALAGVNAVEVLRQNGARLPRKVRIGKGKNAMTLTSPGTYVPTGWYPNAIEAATHPEGEGLRIYVTNLKGMGAGPGVNGGAVGSTTGSRPQGSLSVITRPSPGPGRRRFWRRWTKTTIVNNNWVPLFDRRVASAGRNPCLPAPLPDGSKTLSHILCDAHKERLDRKQLHVVYIVKENKTFDQYFGDLKATVPDADADPEWMLYGDGTTTNQHNLAEQFGIMDNFWADSEASTTGHSWTSAGYATEYVEITWNTEYDEGLRGKRGSGRYQGQIGNPDEDLEDENVAEAERELFEPAERLVDLFANPQLNDSGATFRIYSDDVEEDSPAVKWRVPLALWGFGSSAVHHGRDLDFPDTDRARMFIDGKTISHAWGACGFPPDQDNCGKPPPDTYLQEIKFSPEDREKFTLNAWKEKYQACREAGDSDLICQRAMPNFLYMALPVDHTLGFNPEMPTPDSMVADNDNAVGMIVDALSKSPFWERTLVVITEDDTQAAGDHVDAHRTFLLTAGGLARPLGSQGLASHQLASFPSILKTVEVLFGLPSLTIYDRAAVPLHDIFVRTLADANEAEYTYEENPVEFALNPGGTLLGDISQQLDWTLDQTDPFILRDLLYAGLKGWPLPKSTAALARHN